MEKYRVTLTADERNALEKLISVGRAAARKLTHLYEEVVYDAHGQLVTGSLMEYAVPKASMLPPLETARTVTPSLLNPLGAKGIGEAGTSGSAPAVANAIIDALAPFGVTHLEMPLKPEKLWWLMHHGTHAGTSDRPSSAATRC
jgi:hypothetical protein